MGVLDKIRNTWAYYVLFVYVLVGILRNVIGRGPFSVWDMIPRFTGHQVLSSSLYAWDQYLNRPNFRAIQSSISIWMLYSNIQWIGILLSYLLLFIANFMLFERVLYMSKSTGERSSHIITGGSLLASLLSSTFVIYSEGQWYHSIILGVAFMILALVFSIDYIYSGSAKPLKLYCIFLLIVFSPMITYMYFAVFLFLLLYVLRKLHWILNKIKPFWHEEDRVIAVLILATGLYLLRVVLPTLHGSTTTLEYSMDLKITSLSPTDAVVPISKFFYFYNIKRLSGYIVTTPKIVGVYLYPLMVLISILITHQRRVRHELIVWAELVILLSIFSSMGAGIYTILKIFHGIPYLGKLFSLAVYPIRKPPKWTLILSIYYGIFIALLLDYIFSYLLTKKRSVWGRSKIVALIIVIVMLMFSPLLVYPANLIFSGDAGGAFRPLDFPQEYQFAMNKVNGTPTLVFPILVERPVIAIANDRKMTDELFIYYFNGISYEAGGFESYPYNVKYLGWIYKLLVLNETRGVARLISPLGIKKIIYQSTVVPTIPDTSWRPILFSPRELSVLPRTLSQQDNLSLLIKGNTLRVYSNNVVVAPLVKSKVLINLADLDHLEILTGSSEFGNYAVVNLDFINHIKKPLDDIDVGGLVLPNSVEGQLGALSLFLNGSTILDTSTIRFSDSYCKSYRYAYSGISSLSRYYSLYGHLGFPSISEYPVGCKEGGTLQVSTKVPSGKYILYLRGFSKNGARIKVDGIANASEQFEIPRTHYMKFLQLKEIDHGKGDLNITLTLEKGSLIFDALILVDVDKLNQIEQSIKNKTIYYMLFPNEMRSCDNGKNLCGDITSVLPTNNCEVLVVDSKDYRELSSKDIIVERISHTRVRIIEPKTKAEHRVFVMICNKRDTNLTSNVIQSYHLITPTKWRFVAHLGTPGYFIFPEAYDPNWRLTVYKNGKVIEKESPLLGYSAINIFPVKSTGDVVLIVGYIPQRTLWAGTLLSLASSLLFGIYVLLKERRKQK